MVAQRKNTPSYISKNLRHLRTQKGFTLEQLADAVGLQDRTSYYAYESGKAVPDVFKLLKLASLFDTSLEDIVNKDLTLEALTADALVYTIEKVPISARAGYGAGYGDPEWLITLPKINIPYKPYGITRAFDIEGDSMEPEIKNGSTVIAIKSDSSDLRDNRTYIIVTKDGGLFCKDIRLSENDSCIYLMSKNNKYPPKHIEKSDVMELWEVWKTIKPGET